MSRRRWMSLPALVLAAAGATAACGEAVSLGRPGSQDELVTESPGCEGAPCGAACTMAFGVTGTCDHAGVCSTSATCSEPWPCAGKICGEACSICAADGTSAVDPGQPCDDPMAPMFCDASGECTPEPPACVPWDPCAGPQPCGQPCLPCNPDEVGCAAPPELFVCDAASSCVPASQVACEPCFDNVLAAAKFCGEPCDPVCQPWEEECETPSSQYVCGAEGECILPELVRQCSVAFEACPETARCGDPCAVCDERQGNCFRTPGLFCTGPLGQCVDQLPECPESDCIAEGLVCGAQCGFCPPEDVQCQPRFCDASGSCVSAQEVSCGTQTCDGMSCGEPCALCDSTTSSCDEQSVFLACDGPWGCTDTPTCGYVPCAGKVCGEACSDWCDPYDTSNCMPDVIRTCNAAGECVDDEPSCF